MRGSVDKQTLVTLPILGDARGSLCAIEGERDINFAIARVYYIFGTQAGVSRGFHAHRALCQLAICVSGSCRMLLDDGRTRSSFLLDRPDVGLSIGPMIWREMHDFSAGAVLMVLADRHYDEADYIRDYDAFLSLANAVL